MVNEARMLPQLTQSLQLKSIIWMAFTASVVLASQIKTIADYLLRNVRNLLHAHVETLLSSFCIILTWYVNIHTSLTLFF